MTVTEDFAEALLFYSEHTFDGDNFVYSPRTTSDLLNLIQLGLILACFSMLYVTKPLITSEFSGGLITLHPMVHFMYHPPFSTLGDIKGGCCLSMHFLVYYHPLSCDRLYLL